MSAMGSEAEWQLSVQACANQPRDGLHVSHRLQRLSKIAAMFARIPVVPRRAGICTAVHSAAPLTLQGWELAAPQRVRASQLGLCQPFRLLMLSGPCAERMDTETVLLGRWNKDDACRVALR